MADNDANKPSGRSEEKTGGEKPNARYGEDGRLVRRHLVLPDVAERKGDETALKNSEAKMKALFRAAPTGIGMVVDRVIQEVNQRFCELTGYAKEELIGRNARMVYPSEEDFEFVGREKYRQIERHGIGTVETRLQRKDGRILDVLLSSSPLDPSDLSQGSIFTAIDITERRKAEEVLQKYRKTLEAEVAARTAEIEDQYRRLAEMNRAVKKMAQRTILTMENDRKALSKEIHDSIGGSLAAIKMLLETQLQKLVGTQPDSVHSMEKIIDHLRETIKESKRISHQMRPRVLDDFGLKAAVAEIVQKFNQFYPRITVNLRIRILHDQIPDEIKTVIYRVVQEALNNIGKHSHADAAEISLTETKDRISLEVVDNGCGFDAASTLGAERPLQGYGLLSMQERVKICRGSFALKSEAGKGTRISASIPKSGV